jgi:hypothetical protein
MTNAIRSGFAAGYQAWNEEYFIPLEDYLYDSYKVRLARYWQFRLYADNTIFTTIQKYAESQKKARGLYRHIRSIYNPVSRLIDLEVAKVYGGNIDYANQLSGGAIPIVGADETLLEAIAQLFVWSNMGAAKNRFVREGATYGDSSWKVIDDKAAGKVRLEVLDPRKIADVKVDAVDNVKAIRIEYLRYDEAAKKDYLYTEIIDQESFRTFKENKPFAYYEDGAGNMVDGWDNEYGFVPVRLAKHKDAGGDVTFGTTSFNTSLSKIDALNDLASNIHDAIRKNINPQWGIAGNFNIQNGAKITSPAEKKDEQPFVKFPEGATITPLVFALDLPGAIGALDKLIKEIEADMPQLALQRMRETGGNVSGVTIKNLYGDSSDRLLETQGNYDAAMVAAVQMGVTIGGHNGYRGFEAFDLDSYDAGDLEFTIKPRPIFSDELDKSQKITLTLQAADSPAMRLVLAELGYNDEQIDEVEDTVLKREAAAMRGIVAEAFGESAGDEEDEDGTDTEAEANTPAEAVEG